MRNIPKSMVIKFLNMFNKRDKNLWVFGEWFGERCYDNCCSFANEIVEKHPEIKVFWITNTNTDITHLSNKVRVLTRDSQKAINVLKRCSVAVINQDLTDFSSGKYNYVSGAIILQLWHGIAWKKIGYEAVKANKIYIKMVRLWGNFNSRANMYVSPSQKYDTILVSAFDAKRNEIVHAGFPRNKIFYCTDDIFKNRKIIENVIYKMNPALDVSKCRIISYMPTFKNREERYSVVDLLKNDKSFLTYLRNNDIIFLEKTHYINQKKSKIVSLVENERFFVINDVSPQELLSATDLLVTDYSSVFFDFLMLDRPIVYYLYDYEYYKDMDRGLYYGKEEVIAGDEANTEEQLVDAIIRNLENPDLFKKRRHKIKSLYMNYDTEDSCEIIYNAVKKRLNQR